MQRYVLDASVIAKLVLEEDGQEKVKDLLSSFLRGNIDLVVPEFWTCELGNTIRYSVKNPSVKKELFSFLLKIKFSEIFFDEEEYLEVLELAEKYGVTFYDALYYFLALKENIPLITADEKFAKRIKDKKHVTLLRDFVLQ